jgi:Ca2+:H+ antiporter
MVDLIRQLLVSRWSLLLPFTLLTLLSSAGLGLKGIPVVLSFALHGLGLVPLGRMVAVLVHALARRLGNRLGGLVSVTLGNLVDLVVLFTALNSGLYPLVVTSLAGAVITNCLLVLGLSTLVASRRVIAVPIHPHSTQLQTQQLLISSILLSVPTIFLLHQGEGISAGSNSFEGFALYSVLVSALVLGYYLLSFVYQLGTHRRLFAQQESSVSERIQPQASMASILGLIALVSLMLVGVSDALVNSLEQLVEQLNLSPLFVGLFLLPLFGSFAEALVAIQASAGGNMDLTMSSTVESSLQLLLFVLPVLVLSGLVMGRYLHLAFPPVALACLGCTVLVVDWISKDRQLSWYEGLQLLLLYASFALGALLLPAAS